MPLTSATSTKISGSSGPLGGGAGERIGGGSKRRAVAVDEIAVGIKLTRQQAQKALASRGVERQIAAPELGGAGPGRDLAAAPVEAAQHLLAQPRRVVLGQIGPRRSMRQHAARR